jgi:peptidylprolyl isomerase
MQLARPISLFFTTASLLAGQLAADTTQLNNNLSIVGAPVPTQEEIADLSETLGHLIGHNMENPVHTFAVDKVIKGIENHFAGQQPPLTFDRFETIVAYMEAEAREIAAKENLEKAEKFLAANKRNPKVSEMVPGKVQYEVIKEGKGPLVTPHSAPKLNYKATCLDGTVIGDSAELNESVIIPLDQTVPGFQQAVCGMRTGEKRIIYVHPELAYGTASTLPPNSLITFEVEVTEAGPALAPAGTISSTTTINNNPVDATR